MPPFPARRAVGIGLALTALIAVGAVVAIPRIDESKRRGREGERRALAEDRASERRRLAADQAPVTGSVPRPVGPLTAGRRLRARRALVGAVERAITREARGRVAAGTLTGRVLRTDCTPSTAGGGASAGEGDLRRRRGAYDCLAVTREIPATSTNAPGLLGHPFRAVVDFRRFAYAFCKTNPPAGERAVPDPRSTPPLPRACTRL